MEDDTVSCIDDVDVNVVLGLVRANTLDVDVYFGLVRSLAGVLVVFQQQVFNAMHVLVRLLQMRVRKRVNRVVDRVGGSLLFLTRVAMV